MPDNVSDHNPPGATSPNNSPKNKTSRISLDSARPLDAKKATGLVPGIATHAGPIPQTIRLKRPPTSPIAVQPANLPPLAKKTGDTALSQASAAVQSVTTETVKRQTSRIVLTQSAVPKITDFKRATGPISGIPTHAGPIPQTIRLKRPATAPIQPAKPAVAPTATQATKDGTHTITEAPTIIRHVDVPKSPTSHVVLDNSPAPASIAIKQQTTQMPPIPPMEPLAPKTIRLKRPSSLSDAEESIRGAATEAALQTAKKGETAKIELPLEDSSLTPITQRKTIKIKRADRTVTPRTAASEPAAQPKPPQPRPDVLVETPVPEEAETLVFPIVAFAASLCIAALIYIMAAQAFGVHLLLPSSMQLH